MILWDTDTCIELLRGNKTIINRRNAENDEIAISFMTVAELHYGSEKSNNKKMNNRYVEEFILTVKIINSDIAIMKKFGEIKALLENRGIPLADADLFVAATSLVYCTKLITGNIKHYNRIESLTIEDWIR